MIAAFFIVFVVFVFGIVIEVTGLLGFAIFVCLFVLFDWIAGLADPPRGDWPTEPDKPWEKKYWSPFDWVRK